MKYILLKDLPLAKAGIEVSYKHEGLYPEIFFNGIAIGYIPDNIPEWLEEVKEPKTIYDLKKGDIAFSLDSWGEIGEYKLSINGQLKENNSTTYFITEIEAKRNKLLRELATREKWLPKYLERYINQHSKVNHWDYDECEIMWYHMGLVFRDELEYDKWMTEEAKDLLFKL